MLDSEELTIYEDMNFVLNYINKTSVNMPDYIFELYEKRKKNNKPIYNLVADSFKDLQGYSVLMLNNCWSQAATILRLSIERISKVIVLSDNPNLEQCFLDLHNEYFEFNNKSKEEQKQIKKEIEKREDTKINNYFEYSWARNICKDGKCNRNEILRLAHLEESKDDIEEFLNKFTHGTITIFDFSADNWNAMRMQGARMNSICFVLFYHLYISTRLLFGNSNVIELPIDETFKMILSFLNKYDKMFYKE